MTPNVKLPLTGLSTRVDRLTSNSSNWSPERIIDEGLDIVRDHCWAASSTLYVSDDHHAIPVGHRPHLVDRHRTAIDLSWFPWGLSSTNAERFIFVRDAGRLPVAPGSSVILGDHDISSCAHLPIIERGRPIGYLQIHWEEPRLVWDDDSGRALRVLARYLLAVASGLGLDAGERRLDDVVPLQVTRHERLDDRGRR